MGLGNEVVGGVSLGGHNDHHVAALLIGIRNDPGNIENALRIGDGRAAEFLYDQFHKSLRF